MGGGNSKTTKTETIKVDPKFAQEMQRQVENQQVQAAEKPKGPSSKPMLDVSQSPQVPKNKSRQLKNEQQESTQKYPTLKRNDSGDLADDMQNQARPNAIAKQTKRAAEQAPPKPSPQQQENLMSPGSMNRQKANDMIAQQRKMEEDKLRQLQIIKEQQKAKEAAQAAKRATQQQNVYQDHSSNLAVPSSGVGAPSYLREDTNGSEVFAMHNSPAGTNKSVYENQSSMGSPGKSLRQSQNGNLNLQINGTGMQRQESINSLSVAPPQASFQYKVIEYGDDQFQQTIGRNDGMYDKFGTAATTGSGIHIGMMDQQDYKKDAEQNRNIDMAELQALLGN